MESLPASGMTLVDARRYARWRFCRLPTFVEWRYAATGRGSYEYPWGNRFRAEWVNTADLGLNAPTPVGTFESGRDRGGAYDLIGNVAEWTESVAPYWFDGERSVAGTGDPEPFEEVTPWHNHGLSVLRRTPAMRLWLLGSLPAPGFWMVQAWGAGFPRLAVGGHYRTRRPQDRSIPETARSFDVDGLGWVWERGPLERGDTVGIRLANDPVGLLVALLREPLLPGGEEEALLRAFLRSRPHRAALAPALERAEGKVQQPGPLLGLLREELGS